MNQMNTMNQMNGFVMMKNRGKEKGIAVSAMENVIHAVRVVADARGKRGGTDHLH